MRVCLTVDVEQDCPPYLQTWRGVDEGLPWLLETLAAEGVPATFFVTGDAARRAPARMRDIVAAGHELACHGDRHLDFGRASVADARRDVEAGCEALRPFGPVTSFRAPYLRLPLSHVPVLGQAGITLDSSQARYKTIGVRPHRIGALARVPVSVTSSVLRVPAVIRDRVLSRLQDPVVLFVHPWEFVDLRREPIRWDCRFRTGDGARADWRSLMRWARANGGRFMRMRDCVVA